MKVIIEDAPEDLPTEDLNVHFSALGDCSITRSVPLTQASRVTVSYPEFSAALQTLLSLHFAPLLKVPKLTFAVECSIDVTMQEDVKGSETQQESDAKSEEKQQESEERADQKRSRSRSPRKDESDQADSQQTERLNAEEKKSDETKPGDDNPTEAKDALQSTDGEKKECKKRGRKGSPVGVPKNIHVESDGSHFQVIRKYKDDDMTQLQCLSCKRKVLKRSAESHVASATHKRNFSRKSK